MKRLSALLALACLAVIPVSALHAQPTARRTSDTTRLAQYGPVAPATVPSRLTQREPEPAQIPMSRALLTSSAESAARAARLRSDQLRPVAPPPVEIPTRLDTIAAAPGRSKQLGVGFLATLPTAGFSAIINLTPNTAAQGLLGLFFAGLKTVTGRYLYYFRETTNFQPYVYGELGAWSYEKQVVLGFGGGAGLEYFIERYPFVSFSFEFTLREIGFDADVYDISGLAVGGGLHYYF